MKLSILVCTIPSRVDNFLPKIITSLTSQATDDVEILWLGDNKNMTIGEKRNKLINISQGEYVAFVDDDDRVSDDYIQYILAGIRSKADIIVFKAIYTPNKKEVVYNTSFIRDKEVEDKYIRLPNHLMCVKKDIAKRVMYKKLSFREDADYAKRLKKEIKSQANINKVLYYYDYDGNTSEAC